MKTEILIIGKFQITLPIGLMREVETKVRDAYHDFLKESTRDVRRHLTCLTTLLPPELPSARPMKVFHMFGGLGASAQVIDQSAADEVEHEFWERDVVCIKYLREHYPDETVVHVQDSYKMLPQHTAEWLARFDVLLLDASVATIKTSGVRTMWECVAASVKVNPDQVIWFTDTACHKIHLNYKSYEADFGYPVEPTAESYLNAYSQWLEDTHGLVITAAMREAGEFYCIVKAFFGGNNRFSSIGYV